MGLIRTMSRPESAIEVDDHAPNHRNEEEPPKLSHVSSS
jgi:hypothetical protein